jgi:hypothetical protein
LTASDVDSWLAATGAAYKTAPLTRSTSTPANDPDLSITLPASSAFYEITCAINYSVVTGGFQVAWTVPAGVTGALTASMVLGGTGGGAFGYTWGATFQAGNQTSPNGGIIVLGNLATAGTGGQFALKWANGTGANTTTIGAGSYLTARRVG